MKGSREFPAALLEAVPEILELRLRPWLEPGEQTGLEGAYLPDQLIEVTLFVDRSVTDERWACSVRVVIGARDEALALGVGLDAAEAALAEWLEAGRSRRSETTFAELIFEGEAVGLCRRYLRPRAETEADKLLEGQVQPGSD